MSANKALTANTNLMVSVNAAIAEALKAGLTKDEIAAYLTRMAEMLENADD